jgi:hypothetical protein
LTIAGSPKTRIGVHLPKIAQAWEEGGRSWKKLWAEASHQACKAQT